MKLLVKFSGVFYEFELQYILILSYSFGSKQVFWVIEIVLIFKLIPDASFSSVKKICAFVEGSTDDEERCMHLILLLAAKIFTSSL